MRRITIYMVLFVTFCVAPTGSGQTTATATRAELLDAFWTLWERQDRMPTPEEIDAGDSYKSAQYLSLWGDWPAVRQALIDHLVQKAQLQSISGDPVKAIEFYNQVLKVEPQHADARNALLRLSIVELDGATGKLNDFTVDRAGKQSADMFNSFLVAYSKGQPEQARLSYQRAVALKQAYVAAETERLKKLFAEADELYRQQDYERAFQKYQELAALKPDQAGYIEAEKAHAGEIASRMESLTASLETRRTVGIGRTMEEERLNVWVSAGYYAISSRVGLDSNLLLSSTYFKFGSRMGPDIGVSYTFHRHYSIGASLSIMLNTSSAEIRQANVTLPLEFDKGSVTGYSLFGQIKKQINSQIRLYGQTGLTLYRMKFSEGVVPYSNILTFPYSAKAIGFFLGSGIDLFTQLIGEKMTWGLRFDQKVHIVQTKNQPTALGSQHIKLGGLRIGAGLIVAF